MGPEPTREHGITVDQQVLRRDRGGHDHVAYPVHCVRGCDVLKNDFEVGEVLDQGPQHTVKKLALAIEHIDVRVGDFAVDAQHHADLLHALEHRVDVADVRDSA